MTMTHGQVYKYLQCEAACRVADRSELYTVDTLFAVGFTKTHCGEMIKVAAMMTCLTGGWTVRTIKSVTCFFTT